jgi:hypothetical protein
MRKRKRKIYGSKGFIFQKQKMVTAHQDITPKRVGYAYAQREHIELMR